LQLQEIFAAVNGESAKGVTQKIAQRTIKKVDCKISFCSKSKDSFGYIYQIFSYSKQVVVKDSSGMYSIYLS